tara:strand:+ start:9390 stop:9614 length:225 start_codon:yes stop_codon:yes gene_type:complete
LREENATFEGVIASLYHVFVVFLKRLLLSVFFFLVVALLGFSVECATYMAIRAKRRELDVESPKNLVIASSPGE